MTDVAADFLWGTATAGHQVEGNNRNSDTWFAELVPGSVFRQPSGAACDSYHRWREDIDLVVAMGLNAYRFSIEWARIQPTADSYDEAELDRYEQMVDRCHELGIEPIITLNHFTNPYWFAAEGAWFSSGGTDRFVTYVRHVIERLGSKLRFVVTLNEPDLPELLTWMHLPEFVHALERDTIEACTAESGSPAFRLSNVVLPEEMGALAEGLEAAHRAARTEIKRIAPHLNVGFSLAVMDDRVVGNDPSERDRKRAEVYSRWLRLARDDDFLGIQNYETVSYDGAGQVELAADVPKNAMGTAIDPSSLAGAVRYAYAEAGVPILVTEHGLAHDDDALRAAFIPAAIDELAVAVAEGVPVLGYTHWTLLDNFEWVFGYDMHYGLHTVDRATFERTPKASAAAYAAAVAAHTR